MMHEDKENAAGIHLPHLPLLIPPLPLLLHPTPPILLFFFFSLPLSLYPSGKTSTCLKSWSPAGKQLVQPVRETGILLLSRRPKKLTAITSKFGISSTSWRKFTTMLKTLSLLFWILRNTQTFPSTARSWNSTATASTPTLAPSHISSTLHPPMWPITLSIWKRRVANIALCITRLKIPSNTICSAHSRPTPAHNIFVMNSIGNSESIQGRE